MNVWTTCAAALLGAGCLIYAAPSPQERLAPAVESPEATAQDPTRDAEAPRQWLDGTWGDASGNVLSVSVTGDRVAAAWTLPPTVPGGSRRLALEGAVRGAHFIAHGHSPAIGAEAAELALVSGELDRSSGTDRLVFRKVGIREDGSWTAPQALTLARSQDLAELIVTVTGLDRERGGLFRLYAHRNSRTFPLRHTDAIEVGAAEVLDSTVTLELRGLAAGDYALMGFHDADRDGRLDRSLFGLKEGIAVSGTPRSRPPRFSECAIRIAAGSQLVRLEARYP